MQSLALMENNDEGQRTMAKMEVMNMTRDLIPNGNPRFKEMIYLPPLVKLITEHGYGNLMKVVYLMVKDLCNSVNVVRPMTEDQMIEAAGMLLDECGDFRLEDYQIMFTLAKRGQLIKIMDRLDVPTIGIMLDTYWQMRNQAGKQIQEQEFKEKDNRYNDKRIPTPDTPEEKAMSENFGKLAGTMTAWKKEDDEAEEKAKAERRQQQIEGYARLHDINMEEVVKQFKPRKKKKDEGQTRDNSHT